MSSRLARVRVMIPAASRSARRPGRHDPGRAPRTCRRATGSRRCATPCPIPPATTVRLSPSTSSRACVFWATTGTRAARRRPPGVEARPTPLERLGRLGEQRLGAVGVAPAGGGERVAGRPSALGDRRAARRAATPKPSAKSDEEPAPTARPRSGSPGAGGGGSAGAPTRGPAATATTPTTIDAPWKPYQDWWSRPWTARAPTAAPIGRDRRRRHEPSRRGATAPPPASAHQPEATSPATPPSTNQVQRRARDAARATSPATQRPVDRRRRPTSRSARHRRRARRRLPTRRRSSTRARCPRDETRRPDRRADRVGGAADATPDAQAPTGSADGRSLAIDPTERRSRRRRPASSRASRRRPRFGLPHACSPRTRVVDDGST